MVIGPALMLMDQHDPAADQHEAAELRPSERFAPQKMGEQGDDHVADETEGKANDTGIRFSATM